MINWYAISAKYNLELLAVENIERQGFNTYLPKVLKKPNKRKSFNKSLYSAFFPGYLFFKSLLTFFIICIWMFIRLRAIMP